MYYGKRENMSRNKEYIIFGAGIFGKQAAELVDIANVDCFVDNDINKQGTEYLSRKVISFEDALLSKNKYTYTYVVAVSDSFSDSICEQLQAAGIEDYKLYKDLKFQITRDKLLLRPNYIEIYQKAISWIYKNSIPREGVINNTSLKESYPEVTGYYIPTLLRWGHKELACTYAKWLCSIQHIDGAWYDTKDVDPYIFDTAQILKGLIAIYPYDNSVADNIKRGCEWIISCMDSNGKLITPSTVEWGTDGSCSDLIHTYCISPIMAAGKLFDCQKYIDAANRMIDYYITERIEEILNFGLLSHFYAYVMEAMIDIDHKEIAQEAMEKIAKLQKASGAVPAYKNVDWVCSTGLFQLAIVWFRLGNLENGNKAFEYACKLQNESGGWYGSYISEENSSEENTYFPTSEISWAVKYFLDALYYKNVALFEMQAPQFWNEISFDDGRYICVKNVVAEVNVKNSENAKVLDIGCGKGRYIRNLISEYPNNKYYATDLSLPVLQYFDLPEVEKNQGSLTDIPYNDDFFDVVYTCEALEHAVDISTALAELCRVTKKQGKIVIVDKSKDMLGYFEIEEWEQWFDDEELKKEMLRYCSEVEIIKEIDFDSTPANGLFHCWIGTVK